MKKYNQLAKELKMEDAVLVTPQQVYFDKRVILKCLWGCESKGVENLRCGARGTNYFEDTR
jgi:predicted metal-binding protein